MTHPQPLEETREVAELVLSRGFLAPEDLRGVAPEQIGRYEVLSLLGEGAAGQVFLARDGLMDRRVAIKVVRQGISAERLQIELKTLAKLKHPGVVAIYDTGVHEERPFLVMDYAGDHTLGEAELSLEAWVEVLATVLETCAYVHAQDVVHRDLKPANIILGERPAIADFGVAKLLKSGTRITQAGALLGTPVYMAPEQVGGGEVGPWTDVYACGVMLYERLCGALPFDGDSFVELAARIASGVPPLDPCERDRALPPALARVALRALAADSSARPTAEGFAQELRTWLKGGSLQARGKAGAALGVALLLALGLGLSLRGGEAPERAEGASPAKSAKTSSAETSPGKTSPEKRGEGKPQPATQPPASERWRQGPPRVALFAEAFGELASELPAEPSRADARAFAQASWATLLRAIEADWEPPGELAVLKALSTRPGQGLPSSLVRANAWLLRWWCERDAAGETQRTRFDAAKRHLAPVQEAELWESSATAALSFVIASRKKSLPQQWRTRFKEWGLKACRRLAERAPAERALLAALKRHLQ